MSKIGFDITLTGMDDLRKKLMDLPKRVGKKVAVQACVKGQNILRDAAREKAPVWDGDLKRSIRVVKRKQTYTEIIVNVECVKDIAYYAHMVEFGHKLIRVTGYEAGKRKFKDVQGPYTPIRRKKVLVGKGSVDAQPFMRPALDAVTFKVLDATTDALAAGIQLEASKK